MVSANNYGERSFIVTAICSPYHDPMSGDRPARVYRCIPHINPDESCYLLRRGLGKKYKVVECEISGYYFNGMFWKYRLCRPGTGDKEVFIDVDELGKTVFSTEKAAVSAAEKQNRLRKVKVKYLR